MNSKVCCRTCSGKGVVDDGEIGFWSCGLPYENGPVVCIKDCPDCRQYIKEQEIIARMDELGFIARERMLSSADYPDKVFAEVMHMTQDECEEMLILRLSLPKESKQTVHERCLERAKRIREKMQKGVDA